MSNLVHQDDQVLRLRSFGGVSITDQNGNAVPNATDQRRPLAVAIVVAVAGQRGISRDKLVGLLWPDVDPDRARHSLTQALYAARRAFRADDLFVTGNSIRLNTERVSSDVADFELALDSRRFEEAAAIYDGPFLDGFFLSGAAEFEHWVADRRADFEERAVMSLDRLATDAERSGQLERAIEFRKRLAAIRPLDSSAAVRLIELLARTGNRAEAIRQARRHELLLREQLDLRPDPAFAALVARLPDAITVIANGPAIASPAVAEDRRADLVAGPDGSEGASLRGVRRWSSRLTRATIAAAVLAALVVLPLSLRRHSIRLSQNGATQSSSSRPGRLVVAPFNIGGASASTTYIGGAMVELLSPRLRIDSTTKTVDAGTIATAWRARGFDRVPDVPRDSILRLARGLGADRVVVGSVVGSRLVTVLNASMISVADGSTIARATVSGPADSITTMVSELAAKLLVTEAGENERVARRWSGSPVALRRYVAGRMADRRHEYAAAAREYQAAWSLDSNFATAALRLAVAADRLGNAELETDALARAWTHRDELDAGEHAVLLAFIGPRYPQPSSAAEQLQAWEAVARMRADSPEAWYHLGARLFHEGARLGAASSFDQTLTALNRAVALDRNYRPALQLLGAVPNRDSATTDSAGDFDDGDLTSARTIAMSGLWNATRLQDAARAIQVLESRATTTAELIDAKLAEHSLALNEGRVEDAFAATKRLHQLRPDSHAHLRLRVLDALYGDGDSTAAVIAARDLARPIDSMFSGFPLARARREADGCVLGQWRMAHGDTSGVRDMIATLRAQLGRREAPPVSALPGACAELLDASLAVATRRPDALARVLRVDSLMLTAAVAGNASGYAHILMSRLYEQLGHPRRALAAIRKHDYMIGWSAYLATTWREEGRLAAAVGDARGAAVAQRHLVALRAREHS
jgi:DNA-binding SARP family transcriptional activator/tetratricopeptide (TPR) repeat protein